MGYSGGTHPDPTSGDLGDHTETVQIDYDPQAVGYGQLLEVFWESHDPTTQSSSTQYRRIVFHHDEEQRRLAEATRAALEESSGEAVVTEIRPAGTFYRAEAYHQKHELRGHGYLLGELMAIYPDDDDLTDSTAAARINGFLGGEGTADTLCAEIDEYGLSAGGRDALLAYVAGRLGACPE